MPADPVDVIWEVATDERFRSRRRAGRRDRRAGRRPRRPRRRAGLEPATRLPLPVHGRRVDEPAGPHPDAAVRLARPVPRSRSPTASGSTPGAYGAYRHMLDERPRPRAPPRRLRLRVRLARAPTPVCETLADWRLQLRRATAGTQACRPPTPGYPFVCTWDDHEVANNYMGDTLPEGSDDPRRRPGPQGRRLPGLVGAPAGAGRTAGRVRPRASTRPRRSAISPASTCSTSARTPTCHRAATSRRRRVTPATAPPALDEDRTRLGAGAGALVRRDLAEGGVAWNLLGNPVVLAGIDAGTGRRAPRTTSTPGTGSPTPGIRLIEQLAGTDNPVVLTGDYHAGMVLDVHERPFDQDSAVVCTELMAPPISSPLFPQDVSRPHAPAPPADQRPRLPGGHGRARAPHRRFQVLDDVIDATSAIATAATWEVAAGDPEGGPPLTPFPGLGHPHRPESGQRTSPEWAVGGV